MVGPVYIGRLIGLVGRVSLRQSLLHKHTHTELTAGLRRLRCESKQQISQIGMFACAVDWN